MKSINLFAGEYFYFAYTKITVNYSKEALKRRITDKLNETSSFLGNQRTKQITIIKNQNNGSPFWVIFGYHISPPTCTTFLLKSPPKKNKTVEQQTHNHYLIGQTWEKLTHHSRYWSY